MDLHARKGVFSPIHCDCAMPPKSLFRRGPSRFAPRRLSSPPRARRSPMPRDEEANRLSARATRYARFGVEAGAFAAKVGAQRITGGERDDARAFAEALGSMKGPMMKVAQLLATIPDALP